MTVATLFDQLIDQYKLERHLGQKRYTDVYQAYDVDLNRAVTVEILQPLYANDADFADQYVERMRSISQIRHPNIAEILQVGVSPSERPYVALDHVAGNPLSDRLKQLVRQNLPVHSIYALKLIQQIANALSIADRLQIYHYDLRPENILLKNITLKSNDSVVLVDLGIPTTPKQQPDGSISGYYSPEQVAGKLIDSRSHIYSLGVILFELLTGNLPSQPNTVWTGLAKFATGAQSELAKERPDLTPELLNLVETCLQSDPRRRIQTISDFTTAVDSVLTAEELQIRTGSEAIPTSSAPRQQLKRYLSLIFLLFVCGLSGFMMLRSSFFGLSGGIAAVSPTPTMTAVAVVIETEETAVSPIPPTQLPPTATSTPPQPTPTTTATATDTPEPTPTATSTQTPTPTEIPLPMFHVQSESISLREGPGTNYSITTYLYTGDIVTIIARNNGNHLWYNVRLEDGTTGWLSATVGEVEGAGEIPIAATIPAPPVPTSTPIPTGTPIPIPTEEPTRSGGGGPKPVPTATPPF